MLPQNFKNKSLQKTINVFGLGKIGTVLSILHASTGIKVYGFDPNTNFIKSVLQGNSQKMEPGLERLIKKAAKNIEINFSISECLKNSHTSLVIVPTPSLPSGEYSLVFLEDVIKEICENLTDSDFHTIVIKSTVLPGDISKLEKLAQSLTNANVNLVYNPEFIALGDVVKNMQYPDLVLIGARNSRVGSEIAKLNSRITRNSPNVEILEIEEAELAKIALNTFVTTKISFANLIGQAAQLLGSKNPSSVLNAIGNDYRVGKNYLKPGLGYGGPCFPRDNRALSATLSRLNLNVSLPVAVDEINLAIPNKVVKELLTKIKLTNKKINSLLLVGAAYKTGTSEIVESQSVMILKEILNIYPDLQTTIYDEFVSIQDLKREIPKQNLEIKNRLDNLNKFDVIICGLPILSEHNLLDLLNPDGLIINPWN